MEFHLAHRLVLFPPNYVNIARYLTHYSSTVNAYASVQNTLSAIKTFYALYQVTINVNNPIIDMYMKSCRRTMSATSQPKSPIQPAHLVLIPTVLDQDSPLHKAFYSALLIQFFSCVRKSNLLPVSSNHIKSQKHLKRSDLVPTEDSLVLVLPWTKTLQNKSNVYTIPIARSPGAVINPVKTYEDFIAQNPAPANFPAFSYISNGVIKILTQQQYIDVLKMALERLNIPAASYSSHSVRRGGTSALFECQIQPQLIKHHGTWRSNCYTRYLTFSHEQKLKPTKALIHRFNHLFQ